MTGLPACQQAKPKRSTGDERKSLQLQLYFGGLAVKRILRNFLHHVVLLQK